MVWFILGIFVWAVLMALVSPLLKNTPANKSIASELEAYKTEIDNLSDEIAQTGDPELEARKIDLQRQLLTLTQKTGANNPPPSILLINTIFAFFAFGAIGLYAILGRPDLTKPGAFQSAADQTSPASAPNSADVETLLTQLKTRLDTDRGNDPTGWMLYARTLMNIGRFDEAFGAYEKAAALTNNDPNIVEELERAKEFAAQGQNSSPRGPSQADIEAASQMSAGDRNAMVENMVAGLAARLRGEPENPEGWIRLLKARQVLKQSEEAKQDVAVLKEYYSDKPEIIDQILSEAGWSPSETAP